VNVWLGNVVFSYILSFLITFYLIPFFCVIAERFQFFDNPDGILKKHKTAVPYLGGIAVFLGFMITLAFVCSAKSQFFLLMVGSTILLFVGFLDDAITMTPLQKLFGQLIATFCFLKAGLFLKVNFFFNFWNIPLSLLWILTVVNAFNLVDVMDGLASILALCATAIFIGIAIFLGVYDIIPILAAFMGALLAFFWYNRPNARIYLGDAGSLFIGGFLAVIPFLFNWGAYNWFGYLTPLIILGIPLLEIIGLICIRTYKRIPFFKGSPDHFSSYLLSYGWSKVSILIYVAVLSLLLMLGAFLFVSNRISLSQTSFAALLFIISWVMMLKNLNP